MTLQTKRLTNRERATNLYIRDKVIQPISKRTNIANPVFRGASLEVQSLELPEVVLEGAAGCIAGETRIYNPITRANTPVVELYNQNIAPVVLTMHGAVQAEVPFRKGVADLYRVKMKSGNSFIVTLNHRLLTVNGWSFVSDVSPGAPLLGCDEYHRESSSEFCRSTRVSDVQNCEKIIQDCPGNYSLGFRQCDVPLLVSLDSDQVFVPSLDDVLGHNRAGHGLDDRSVLQEHNHRGLSFARHSRNDFSQDVLLSQMEHEECCSCQCSSECLLYEPSRLSRFQTESNHPNTSCESIHHSEHTLRHALFAYRTSWGYYKAQLDTVSSIEFERTDEYFDLHVPTYEHYLAEGIWHHNTGKTLAILYKLHQLALNNPGARILIVRKTRESMNESVLATFEQDILGESSDLIPKGQRNARHSYNYPNGAQIIVAGLQSASTDQRERIMSSSYDVAYVCECSELSESDWNRITSRLRNGKMDYQGIIGDLNPTTPSHWLYVREAHGKVKILQSYHQDNPALHDGKDWTPKGKAYINKLSNLTGLDRVRLFEGRRGSAQGVIYGDVWQDGALDGNVTELAEYVPEMKFDPVKQKEIDITSNLYWFCDDGYVGSYDEELQQFTAQSHPRVILLAQVRDDGKVCIFEESFKIQTLPEKHIKMVEELGYAEPFKCVVDKSAVDLIARLNERYNAMQQKIVDVEEGIKLVRSYIAPDENGVRKLLIHPRCRFTRFEFASYKRDEKGKILKEHDHAMDAIRYGLSVIASQPRPNFRTLG